MRDQAIEPIIDKMQKLNSTIDNILSDKSNEPEYYRKKSDLGTYIDQFNQDYNNASVDILASMAAKAQFAEDFLNLTDTLDEFRSQTTAIAEDIKGFRVHQDAAHKKVEGLVVNAKDVAAQITNENAKRTFDSRLKTTNSLLWAFILLAIVSGFALAWAVIEFYPEFQLQLELLSSAKKPWQFMAIYAMSRIAVLGALTGLMYYFLRMVRAHLHMVHTLEHKIVVLGQLTNFKSLLDGSNSDLVLIELIKTIVDFGDSGLLGKQADTDLQNVSLSLPKLPGGKD